MFQPTQVLIILFLIIAIAVLVYGIRKMIQLEKRIVHIDYNIEKMLKKVSKRQKKLEEELGGLG